MPINSKLAALLTVLTAIAPTMAHGQVKPTVTVVNPATNPVNTRITNAVVPVEVRNAAELTHVGQKPSQIVTLGLDVDSGGRTNPDTGGSADFQVPAGFVFVLTDIEWHASCVSGTPIAFTLVRHRPDGGFDRPIRGQATCAGGEASFERHYTTGEVFGAGQRFTADGVIAGSGTPALAVFAEAHGYLVPAN